jgi:hypothetical protein
MCYLNYPHPLFIIIVLKIKVKELEASFHRILRKFEDNMQEIISSVYNESPERAAG